ncbi:hypothetical protein GE09DRAFT_1220655 [Coniochaeta sp. 2T2.1]|nr:hypothetical protein GE09DRAFT_1220655 [Coniochaeta sp. 2T2.1]
MSASRDNKSRRIPQTGPAATTYGTAGGGYTIIESDHVSDSDDDGVRPSKQCRPFPNRTIEPFLARNSNSRRQTQHITHLDGARSNWQTGPAATKYGKRAGGYVFLESDSDSNSDNDTVGPLWEERQRPVHDVKIFVKATTMMSRM